MHHFWVSVFLLLAALVAAPVGTLAGYDQQAQVQSVRHLIEVLDGVRSWESGK